MAAAVTRRPNTGLSKLARQDYLARVRKETSQRFQIIFGFATGYAGLIPASVIASLSKDKLFAKTVERVGLHAFIAAVLRLNSIEVQQTEDGGLRYAVLRRAA